MDKKFEDRKGLFFDYLNDLRESGETNMLGAGEYLEFEFALDKKDARDVLLAWMESFNDDEPEVTEPEVSDEDKELEGVLDDMIEADEVVVEEPEVVEEVELPDEIDLIEPEMLDSLPQDTQYPDGNVYAKHTKDGLFQVSHTTKKRAYFVEGQTKKFASFDHIDHFEVVK